VTNQANAPRQVRLFFHYDWHIWEDTEGNTVFYDPSLKALVAYKQQAYFLMNGQVSNGEQIIIGIANWATGSKEFHGSEGTWRDASEPLSVSPLTWSHAEYILTVRWYIGKYHRLQKA
jgi:GH15 family glucan-1,4-alpha-glucosidase